MTIPLLSIVIPAKNEEMNLPGVIHALDEERIKNKLIGDIIVVDNFSSDQTWNIARNLPCRTMQANGKVGNVRNIGAALTDTPYIGFIDADVIISPGWSLIVCDVIRKHEQANSNCGLITGSIYDISESANWLEKTWTRSLQSRQTHRYINGGNLVIDSRLFNRIGGFNENLISGEDCDLCVRAVKAGGKLIYNPDIHTIHLGYPKTISHFIRRELWHGREMLKDSGNPFKNKALILALIHLFIIVCILLSLFINWRVTLSIVLAYPVLPIFIAILRVKDRRISNVFYLSILMSIYGFTRAWALVYSCIEGIKGRFRSN